MMNGLELRLKKLDDDRPRIIEFLRKLVRTPSLSGEEEHVAELIAKEMETLEYEVEVDGVGSVLGRRLGNSEKTVLFDGHMDHVDPGDPESWSHDPYGAEVVDGVLFGRGTVDMKAALAAMIYGCAVPQTEGDILVACVVHEETNEGVAVKRLIEEKGLTPEACILGEPTDLALSVGQRGRGVFRITTRGATSHASMPELGKNALYEMTPIIDRIKESNLSLPSDPFLGAGSVAITSISCMPGAGPIIPDRCDILVDRRLVPGEDLNSILKELKSLAVGAQVELIEDDITFYTGLRAKVEQYFSGWVIDRDHPVVKASLKALSESFGRKTEVMGWKFSTDGVATSGALGIPTIGFGPGDPALAHQPNEHIALMDVFAATRGYYALACHLSSS
jgi:putative selenium metabolism hydrolase